MQDTWNPTQYERFADERSRPFYDLLALVRPESDMRVVDLGCGTGALTRVVHEALKAGETRGIDTSVAMLEKAAASAGGGLSFAVGDLEAFNESATCDLVFSNAAIHWVPSHAALLARFAAALTPRGQLAVQLPANHDHPSHVVANDVAREAPFAEALGGYVRSSPVLEPETYAAILHDLGLRTQHVRLQVYGHVLASRDDVVEWVKGTLLTDYERRIPKDLFVDFLARYRARLLPMLRDTRPYFFPFKRILFWASR